MPRTVSTAAFTALCYLFKLFLLIMLVLNDFSATAQDLRSLVKDAKIPGIEPGKVVTRIFQDSRGFLWFGSETGLHRYDGYQLKNYVYQPYNRNSLSSNIIYSITEDAFQNLWIGTDGGGTNRLNMRNDNITHYLHDPADTNSIDNNKLGHVVYNEHGKRWLITETGINKLVETPAGVIFRQQRISEKITLADLASLSGRDWQRQHFFRFKGALTCFDPNAEQFMQIDIPLPVYEGAEIPGIFDHYFQEPQQMLWYLNTNSQLISYALRSQKIRKWDIPNTIPKIRGHTSFLIDKKQRAWFIIRGHGLTSFDLTSGNDQYFDTVNSDRLTSIFLDQSNVLWLGSEKGVNKINLNRRGFELHQPYPDTTEDTNLNRVSALGEDKNGQIWLTVLMDNHLFDVKKDTFELYQNRKRFPPQLQNKLIKAYLRDSQNNFWLGTLGAHLFRYGADGSWEQILLPTEKQMLVRSIIEDNDGSLWFGVDFAGGALHHYFPETKKITTYSHDPNKENSLSSNLVWTVYRDTKKRLWAGTWGGGLNLHRSGSDHFYYFKNDPADLNSISDNYVTCILETADSTVWFGTWNGGLNRLVDSGETDSTGKPLYRFQHFMETEGLGSNTVLGMLGDKNGKIWLMTGNSLCYFDPQAEKFINYSPEDGVQSTTWAAGAALKSSDGKIYFGGLNGINAFYPDSILAYSQIPAVAITSFKIFEQEAELDTVIEHKQHITIPYSDNFFSFEFAALGFIEPAKNQYQYMLEGIDPGWVNSGSRRLAIYTDVPPGEYVFRARGTNHDGVWNETGASVRLTITPPFWRTGWAYSLYLLFGVGLIYAGKWVVKNWRSLVSLRARRISHYKLLELLGKGGMGEVFKAVDTNSSEIVAIKLLNENLLRDEKNRKRFSQEGRLLASFHHPHIVRVLETGEVKHQGFIAMEYLTGGTLRSYLDEAFPLSGAEAKRIFLQITKGLQEIHRNDIIHRDIKTGNIMLDDEKNIRIMDFGLSKSSLVSTMTTLGTVMGTLGYVAPEQITGIEIDHRVDIFSFGVLMYEVLTNKMPFSGENEMALIHAIFNNDPPLPSTVRSDIDPAWDEIVKKCLAKEPGERFVSVEALSKEIKGRIGFS